MDSHSLNKQQLGKEFTSPPRESEKGTIIIFLLMLMFIGLVIVLGMNELALTRQRTVLYEDYSLRAYYAAEAGLEDILPQMAHLTQLNGAGLEAFLRAPDNGLVQNSPQAIGEDGSSFIRTVQRNTTERIERQVDANQTAQFDLSDMQDISLEGNDLSLSWDDDTCLDGVCQTALEAILVWEVGGAENLILNSSLEESIGTLPASTPEQSWISIDEGEVSVTNQSSFQGSRSVLVQQNTATPGSTPGLTRDLGDLIELEPDTDYTISAYIRLDNITRGQEVRFTLHPYTDLRRGILGSIEVYEEKRLSQATGGDWERIYLSFRTPDEIVSLRPFIHLSRGSRGTFFLDALQLERNSYPTEYCEGRVNNCEWQVAEDGWAPPFQIASRPNNVYRSERYFFDMRAGGSESLYSITNNWDPVDHRVQVSIPISEGSHHRVLRVKSFYQGIDLDIAAQDQAGEPFPVLEQAIEIRSTGQFQDARKSLSVKVGLPTVYPTLDYVLYNHGCVDGECFPRDLVK